MQEQTSLPRCHRVDAGAHRGKAVSAQTITLDETDRHRRRKRLVSDQGLAFLLDLPQAQLLRHGDVLVLDSGQHIVVQAEPEALYEVRADNPLHLLTLAWQLGNRHLPTEIREDCLLIRQDHVIADMLNTLGATVSETVAGFNPEGGAYASSGSGHVHSHSHSHDPAHSHD